MFGNSWMEAEPHQAGCPMVPSGFSSPCVGLDAQVLLVRSFEALHWSWMNRLFVYLVLMSLRFLAYIEHAILHLFLLALLEEKVLAIRSYLQLYLCLCCHGDRRWRRCAPCCWRSRFGAAMHLLALCPTWPAAPMTSVCKTSHT